MNKPLIIAGMHRSGTSMLAGFLKRAGLFLGADLLGANDSNQKGHFENLQFKDLHMNALRALGQNEDGWTLNSFDHMPAAFESQADALIEQNSAAGTWGWKDPRTSLFLNYWAKKLPTANFVFIFRPPWEVADSLYRRGDKTFAETPEFAFQVWEKYNREALLFCQTNPNRCLMVSIDEVVTSPVAFVTEINNRFGCRLSQADPDFESSLLVKSSRQHQRFVHDQLSSAYQLWLQLEAASWRGGQVDQAAIQVIEDPTLESSCREWSIARRWPREQKELTQENQQLQKELGTAKARLEELEQRMSLISNSRLWKLRNAGAGLIGRTSI
jgi:hypothetical protein